MISRLTKQYSIINSTKPILFVGLVLLFSVRCWGQSAIPDSVKKKMEVLVKTKSDSAKTTKDTVKKHKIIPRMATLRSLMFPGLGQIYNRQYWKLPIVYGAFGTTLWIALDQNAKYQTWLVYFRELSATAGTPGYTDTITFPGNGFKYNLGSVTNIKEAYRRNRDYAYFFLAVFYAFAAIDANVSAHLKTFDNTDDISIRFEPDARQMAFTGEPIMGGKIVISF
jgi:hypothetical protein